MSEISTIQKRHKLNEVYREGEVGPGGAYHRYSIYHIMPPPQDDFSAYIQFQDGPRNEPNSTAGVLDCDLLEIVRDRLTAFQSGPYACRENAVALTHIEDALLWMNKRVEDRAERNVLGRYAK